MFSFHVDSTTLWNGEANSVALRSFYRSLRSAINQVMSLSFRSEFLFSEPLFFRNAKEKEVGCGSSRSRHARSLFH